MADYSHLRNSSTYNASTLIGNWMEERDLRRTVLQDVVSRKCTATLRLDAFAQRMSAALQEVELTKAADDPFVHYGDSIQLIHLDTSCVLACDVGDKDPRPGEKACAATGAPEIRAPCARNSFVVLPYIPPRNAVAEPDYGDNILRYGCKVRLAMHPAYTGDSVSPLSEDAQPLCLFSKPVSLIYSSKYTRNQLVGFTSRDSFDTVWEVLTTDPAQRSLSAGLEVLAGAPIILLHCATQKPLVLENQKYPNDFGMELEVTARVSAPKGLKLALEQTRIGIMKGSMQKLDNPDTNWTFMTGTKVQPPEDAAPTHRTKLAQEAMRAVASELRVKHGSIQPLEQKLILWSSSKSELPADDDHIAALVRHYKVQQKPGCVDAADMLAALRNAAA
ncbi:flagellar associated protein [Dunaliella salina]|uniref:Flagellar associated protein n=1 Tax=Dunaliella salina TaxID=3046 RepID=A0ABQ7G961_DUNSA|nr:flagellar associated protein [Dunaliella salina]KAF5831152.1 flagellar associated protein [Dunaliella salina]|eukprot:KAF5831151.1 flagellar associated protein [Dunaliella salina]